MACIVLGEFGTSLANSSEGDVSHIALSSGSSISLLCRYLHSVFLICVLVSL